MIGWRTRFMLLLALVIVAALALWLASGPDAAGPQGPGLVLVQWLGLEVRTNAVAALVVLAVAFLALGVLWRVAALVLGGPARLLARRRARRSTRAAQALERGFVALAAGQGGLARRQAKAAQRLLAPEAPTLLLLAEAARLSSDEDAAAHAYEAMLETPAALAGLHGLYRLARLEGDTGRALDIARWALNRADLDGHRPPPWVLAGIFALHCATHDWAAARKALERQVQAKDITAPAANRRRALLLAGQAMDLMPGARQDPAAGAASPARACALALEAAWLQPLSVPLVALAAQACAATGQARKQRTAQRLVSEAWSTDPHPDLASAWMALRTGASPVQRLDHARKLARLLPDHPESRILVAGAALAARNAPAAREALAPILTAARPDARVCRLMADIEQAAPGAGAAEAVAAWLARALDAPGPGRWMSAGIVCPAWAPVCPVTGKLDALAWRYPEVWTPEAPETQESPEPAAHRPAGGVPADRALENHSPPRATEALIPGRQAAASGVVAPAFPETSAPRLVEAVRTGALPPPPDDPGPRP